MRGPLPRRDALTLGWRWDTVRDAREFAPVLEARLRIFLHATASPTADCAWGSRVRIVSRPRATALALAPTPELALGLARRAVAR